jgi:quercetin dioxygenase-like cupin family protein
MTEILKAAEQQTAEGPAERFTGHVTIRGQFTREDLSRVTGAIVRFDAGARTAWHSHPLGQTLIVLEGTGWTQIDGGPIQEFNAGDIVLCPRDTRHWHGATPQAPMAHVAIQETLDGTNVNWMEHVSDDVYLRGPGIEID